MKISIIVIASLAAFLVNMSVKAQNVAIDDIEVGVHSDDSIYFFDYRLHRNPALILKELKRQRPGLKPVHLYRGNVIYYNDSITAPDDHIKFQTNRIFPYKFDIQLKPFYYAEFGRFDAPFRTQLGIGPRVELSVWKGFYGVFQWIFPFQNDFDSRLGFETRPGEVGIGYSKVTRKKHFINTFLGTFRNDRYGTYLEYIYASDNQRWYFGGSIYYTGKYLYEVDINTLIREPVNIFEVTGNVFAAYRFVQHDLTVRLIAEEYLREDRGVTAELFRQFGSTDIGFYATRSVNGDNAGFFITFALWPRKFYSGEKFQLRFPNEYRLNYNLRPNTGIAFGTRPYTDFFFDIYRFNEHFILNQLN